MVISRRRFAENEKYMHKNKKKARELNMQILWSRSCRCVVDLLPAYRIQQHVISTWLN